MELSNPKMIEATMRAENEKLGVTPQMIRTLMTCADDQLAKFFADADAAIAAMTGEAKERAYKFRRAAEIIAEVRTA